MSLSDKDITAKNFQEFYNRIKPFLNQTAPAGFTPIGTVISVMGKKAPENYLACDGTAYNILEYPELAVYIKDQFGSYDYFGGDGTNTFAVPDLRGEFLRGTGTNSHANQGSGGEVGEHQDGTGIPFAGVYNSTFYLTGINTNADNAKPSDMDSTQSNSTTNFNVNNANRSTINGTKNYTARPTNTSVLYCIAYKNIFIDVKQDYSLNERVVGTWIDGKPIYQKTLFIINKSLSSGDNTIIDDPSFPSISTLISISLINYSPNHNTYHDVVRMYPDAAWTGGINYINTSNGLTIVYNIGSNYANEGPFNIYVTVQYTKTTD